MSEAIRANLTEAEAWTEYAATVERVRRLVLAHPLTNRNEQARAEAMSLIFQAQASAYTMVIAPRQDFPRWFGHSFFEPNVFNWNLPCPDFLYKVAYLDGARTYRISGVRNTGAWAEIQSISGNFGEDSKYNGNYSLDDFDLSPDGAFEIIASATPQPGNWIRLDPDAGANMLQVRRLVYDWEAEVAPHVAIERIDGGPGAAHLTEAELARRIVLAARYVSYVIENMNLKGIERLDPLADNEFLLVQGEGLKATAANPIAVYGQARYAIEPGEALIVETDLPDCLYWNIHLGDIWNQTRDFVDHTSSINGRQAVVDADGRFRAVLSIEDPGVPNWLDPVGATFGRICSRWYGGATSPRPVIRKVPLAELRSHLPADTPLVTPAQRREQVRRRRTAILRHWGY